ncbi:MAG: UDP-N-acetylmuramate dehydrogenase [Bryobacteraceae bacterium]|jgi:UDP-N-acetylmuramate dehydrogenase
MNQLTRDAVSRAAEMKELAARLARIDGLALLAEEPLAKHTRFGLGGPAALLADTASEPAFVEALKVLRGSAATWTVIGGGTNLIVSDGGYAGVVLRFRGSGLARTGDSIEVQSGATLQSVVDFAVGHGLEGLERMTGIPGFTGGAIYGNAGAYGQSISDTLESVRVFDGERVRRLDHAGCVFRYRDSVFKRRKEWLILSAVFGLRGGDAAALRASADEILATRNRKYPPQMRCAGSIFKNLILNELPEPVRAQVPDSVVKKGKVPAAWFLDQAGGRGLRSGGIQVAEYHANLIYNDGTGNARELRALVGELKRRVEARFGLQLEAEVQFLGFDDNPRSEHPGTTQE